MSDAVVAPDPSNPSPQTCMAGLLVSAYSDSQDWLTQLKDITLPADAPEHMRGTLDTFTESVHQARHWADKGMNNPPSLWLSVNLHCAVSEAALWTVNAADRCLRFPNLSPVYDKLSPLYPRIRAYTAPDGWPAVGLRRSGGRRSHVSFPEDAVASKEPRYDD